MSPLPAIEYDQMMDALDKDESTTAFEAADLTKAQYERDSDFGSLTFKGRQGKLHLSEWSARQLCRVAGIPYGVWRKASGKLAADMLHEFFPNLKDPNRKLAIKNFGANKSVLRGVLSVDYPDVRNSDVLRAVGSNLGVRFVVENAGWMEVTNPALFRTRFVTDYKFTANGEELFLGVDITSSEVGAGPLSINLLLYRPTCSNGAIAVYGKKPYFLFDYEHSTGFSMDFADILASAGQRMKQDLNQFIDAVEGAVKRRSNPTDAKYMVMQMAKENQINKGVSVKTLAQIEETGISTLWDVVNAITFVARGYRDMLRVRYETAGGALLGLQFKRSSKKEEDFVVGTPELWLPEMPSSGPTPIAPHVV